jgi:beta-glucosidase
MSRLSLPWRAGYLWAVSCCLALCALVAPPLAAAQAPPWMDPALSPAERTELVLAQMTLQEKVDLMTGDDPGPAQTGAYFNAAIPRLGIPELRTVDIGPGLREPNQDTTYFPQNQAIAATWNPAWGRVVGGAVGAEARATRHNMVLGPNVDIPRQPWWSRLGETYGEDPLLSGRMAANFVRGAQTDGVAVNLKHYNLYTQETNRGRLPITNAIADERTIQEIYTRPWATAVAADLASVMCAFNRVNAEHACEHGYLQEQVLRRQLGFDGFILADFTASYNTVDTVEDGLDMDTGLLRAYGQKGSLLLAAVQAGRVGEDLINERVRNILRVYFKYGFFDRPLPATRQPVPVEEHGGIAREVEHEAITLLKNRDATLPLRGRSRDLDSIAVIGPGANYAAIQCCASAVRRPTYRITPLDGIRERAPRGVDVEFVRGADPAAPWDMAVGPESIPSSVLSPPGAPNQRGVQAVFYPNPNFNDPPVLTRVQPRPAFDNGQIFPFAGHPEVPLSPTNSDAVIFTGSITAPASGEYRLSMSGFGTGQLFLEGDLVVSFANEPELRTFISDPIQLEEGQSYDFRLEYRGTNPQGRIEASSVRMGWIPPRGTLAPDMEDAVALAEQSDVAIVVGGLYEAEQRDRGQLDLPTFQDELIDAVARANPNTVVVLQTGGPVPMPWINQVDSILQIWYGGQEQGRALAEVLFGDVNPSGKLPISYPRFEFQPTRELGIENPALTSLDYDVEFNDGVFVGYRGYERAGTRLQFPFGHGLSYTRFRYRNAKAKNRRGRVSVSFTLRNTGERTGAEVAQVYAGTLPTSVPTPPKQLAGWAKLTLDPGERRRVTVPLACKSLSYWDPGASTNAGHSEGQANNSPFTAPGGPGDPVSSNTDGGWVTPSGRVTIHVGSSVQDIRLTDTVTLRGGTCAQGSDAPDGEAD